MVFEFNGNVFDTDKPIYVCGYVIIDTWFPIRDENDVLTATRYKVSTKRCRIQSLLFNEVKNNETGKMQNLVTSVELDSFHANSYVSNVKLSKKHIYGKSPNECMKIFDALICQIKNKERTGD